MNAIKYLHNRFGYAIKNNGNIKVNQQDIEAINKLVEMDDKINTDLEDSLLLFYLFWIYGIENEKNKVKLKEKPIEEIKFPLGLTPPLDVLKKISQLLSPKPYIIKKITDELLIYQEYERLPKNKDLYINELNEGIAKFGKNIKFTPQKMVPIAEEDKIKYEDVEKLLEDLLKTAKNDFPMLNALSKGAKWKN
jgi:hypothetical protein